MTPFLLSPLARDPNIAAAIFFVFKSQRECYGPRMTTLKSIADPFRLCSSDPEPLG